MLSSSLSCSISVEDASIHLAEPTWLVDSLNRGNQLLLLDSRSFMEYNTSHIAGSVNVGGNRAYRRKFVSQKVSVKLFIKRLCQVDSELTRIPVVVYDQCIDDYNGLVPNSFLSSLLAQLSAEISPIFILKGGFLGFQAQYPELCWVNASRIDGEDVVECYPDDSRLENLLDGCVLGQPLPSSSRHNRIVSTVCKVDSQSGGPDQPWSGSYYKRKMYSKQFSSCCPSSAPEADTELASQPSVILPHLLLGSQSDVESVSVCQRFGITHVINVSQTGAPPPLGLLTSSDRFLRIPLDDNYKDRMMSYFPEAFAFIDGVSSAGGRVLIHCSAGISRSPTLAIAYLMHSRRLTMNEAYNYIKVIRPSIAPNLNFLGQLLEFEWTVQRSTAPPTVLVPGGSSLAAAAPVCPLPAKLTAGEFPMRRPLSAVPPSVVSTTTTPRHKKRERPTYLSIESSSESSAASSSSVSLSFQTTTTKISSPAAAAVGSSLHSRPPPSDSAGASPSEGKRSRVLPSSPFSFAVGAPPDRLLPSPSSIFSNLHLSSPVTRGRPVVTALPPTNSLDDLHFEPCSCTLSPQQASSSSSNRHRSTVVRPAPQPPLAPSPLVVGRNGTTLPPKPILLVQRGHIQPAATTSLFSAPTTPSVLRPKEPEEEEEEERVASDPVTPLLTSLRDDGSPEEMVTAGSSTGQAVLSLALVQRRGHCSPGANQLRYSLTEVPAVSCGLERQLVLLRRPASLSCLPVSDASHRLAATSVVLPSALTPTGSSPSSTQSGSCLSIRSAS